MKDIMFEDIEKMILNDDLCKISDIDSYEASYDYYEVYCKINDESYRILDTRNSRCSDLVFTDTQHQRGHAKWIIEKLSKWANKNPVQLKQHWNHNSSTWDDVEDAYDCSFDGYYGDGLDHIEELNYMM